MLKLSQRKYWVYLWKSSFPSSVNYNRRVTHEHLVGLQSPVGTFSAGQECPSIADSHSQPVTPVTASTEIPLCSLKHSLGNSIPFMRNTGLEGQHANSWSQPSITRALIQIARCLWECQTWRISATVGLKQTDCYKQIRLKGGQFCRQKDGRKGGPGRRPLDEWQSMRCVEYKD